MLHRLKKFSINPDHSPPLPGVRVGDVMQSLDETRLALEIANSALILARDSGARSELVDDLRRVYDQMVVIMETAPATRWGRR